MNTTVIANKIFDRCMTHEGKKRDELQKEIISELLTASEFYLAAAENTKREEWKAGNCEFYHSSDRRVVIFVDRADAERFARQNGILTEESGTWKTMILDMNLHELSKALLRVQEGSGITEVKIYAKRPLYIFYPISKFIRDEASGNKTASTGAGEAESESAPEMRPCRTFMLVDEIKKFLDTAKVSERRNINPGLSYENGHEMIERLIAANQIEKDELERELNLPHGMLTTFCKEKASASISKKALQTILSYFGLEEYLYQYKNCCTELMHELKENPSIDQYEIVPSAISTNEKFTLASIKRGKIKKDGAFAYKLTLKSDKRELETYSSTPRNFIVGNIYEITELEGKKSKPEKISKGRGDKPSGESNPTEPLINNSKAQRYTTKAEERAKRNGGSKEEQMQRDTNELIRYFKEEYGDNTQAASAKLVKLLNHEDIIKAFAQFVRKKGPGRISVGSYTAGKLMQELGFEPYEAYCVLVDLREQPKETKQMLIYRERDPQYQKKK